MAETDGNCPDMIPNTDDILRLRIIHINDVYKLDNFSPFKTLVNHYSGDADKTIVVLAGDFLGPSLLSSLDRGRGFVDVMGACGVTHVCFGNHETDIPMEALRERINESSFSWLNTNMRELDEKLGVTTPAFDLVTVSKCMDDSNSNQEGRTVALLGLLTEDPSLYRKGAFCDATIEPVMDATKDILQKLPENVDLVVPLTHQSMAPDREFAQHFGGDVFPIFLGGHDHEIHDEAHNGCRIIKTGMDVVHTGIVDIEWSLCDGDSRPTIHANMVPTTTFPPDKEIAHRVQNHEHILRDLEMAKLFRIDCETEPFTTERNRLFPTNGSRILATAVRKGMRAECALLIAGCIRGGKTYDDMWFTWSDLKAEMPFSTEIITVDLPGRVLSDTITYSRKGAYETPPIEHGGYMQTCDMIHYNDDKRFIESIQGKPFNPNESYLTALPVAAMNGMDNNVPLLDWCSTHACDFSQEAGRPAKMAIVELFAAQLWLELGPFSDIDFDRNGVISLDELKDHAEEVFERDIADLTLSNIMAVADIDVDGCIKPCEMVTTQFIATDMMSHVCTSQEVGVMTRLASEMLNLPTSHNDVRHMVHLLQQRIDKKKNGRMTREEAIEALGKLVSKEMLS